MDEWVKGMKRRKITLIRIRVSKILGEKKCEGTYVELVILASPAPMTWERSPSQSLQSLLEVLLCTISCMIEKLYSSWERMISLSLQSIIVMLEGGKKTPCLYYIIAPVS